MDRVLFYFYNSMEEVHSMEGVHSKDILDVSRGLFSVIGKIRVENNPIW